MEMSSNLTSDSDYQIVWQPQINKKDPTKPHPQQILVDCPIQIILYGGARGGGKTDGALGKVAIKCHQYVANIVFFREEVTQADDLIERAKEIYLPLGAEYKVQQKQFNFPNGSRVRFRGLKNLDDAKKYQGQNLTDAFIEEAGNYADPNVIWTIFGALRSVAGYPAQLVLTCNPGGSGHYWIKELFVDPFPNGNKILRIKIGEGYADAIYIPSRVTDNYILLSKDPGYIDRLKLVGSKALVRAWLYGDWNAIQGAFFTLTEQNFIDPFNIPEHWQKYIGQDWGYRDPFAATWLAVSSGFDDAGNPSLNKGTKVIYRCISKTLVENHAQADMIYQASAGEVIKYAALDPSCWSSHGNKSIAQQLNEKLQELNSKWIYSKANNNRIAGWSLLTAWINTGELKIFGNLANLIVPLQTLPVDKDNVEDVNTKANDHAPDSLRYAAMQYLEDSVYLEPDPSTIRSNGINLANVIKRYKQRSTENRI